MTFRSVRYKLTDVGGRPPESRFCKQALCLCAFPTQLLSVERITETARYHQLDEAHVTAAPATAFVISTHHLGLTARGGLFFKDRGLTTVSSAKFGIAKSNRHMRSSSPSRSIFASRTLIVRVSLSISYRSQPSRIIGSLGSSQVSAALSSAISFPHAGRWRSSTSKIQRNPRFLAAAMAAGV